MPCIYAKNHILKRWSKMMRYWLRGKINLTLFVPQFISTYIHKFRIVLSFERAFKREYRHKLCS